ncbi:GumC domain-containing protein [Flexibacterium corallicola]|uniref:hypothetical protein n=1 Tax=Flexibacterium corallicola TaxID=3037259 RepID=UPI00286EC42F|nr:hypothetical protein [Pseudovibrio sp. M1P-2-3]
MLFEARTKDVEKKLERMDRAVNKSMRGSQKAVGRFDSSIKAASATAGKFSKTLAGLSFAGGIAGALTFSGAIDKAMEGIEDFDRVAKTARQNGFSGEFFQTLGFMAGESSVEISTLETALRKFTIGVGEAKYGTGELYNTLSRANRGLLEQLLNATTNEERLKLYADAVANAQSAEEKALLTKAAFGQRGADLVRVLEQGSKAFDESGQKAKQLGNIIEDEILEQAEELQNRLGNASDALDKQLKAALIDITPYMINFNENMAASVKWLREMKKEASSGFGDFKGWLNGQVGDISPITVEDVASAISKGLSFTDKGLEQALKEGRGRLKELQQVQAEFQREHGVYDGPRVSYSDELIQEAANRQQEQINDLRANLAVTQSLIKKTNASASSNSGGTELTIHPTQRVSTLPTSKPILGIDDVVGTRNDNARAAVREAESVNRVIEALQMEQAALTQTQAQRRLSYELRAAGAGATDAQKQQIEQLVTQIDAQRQKQEQLNEVAGLSQSLFYDVWGTFNAGIQTGNSLLDTMLNKLADPLLQALISGEGPFAGIFGGGLGNLFSGGVQQGVSAAAQSAVTSIPVYHDGLLPDEYLALLERGESVVTDKVMGRTMGLLSDFSKLGATPEIPEISVPPAIMLPSAIPQVSVMGAAPVVAPSAPPQINVNVSTPPGTTADVQQRQSGGRTDLQVIIKEVDRGIAGRISSGQSQIPRAISGQYKLDRKT